MCVLPMMVRGTLLGLHELNVDKKKLKVWKATPLCIFSFIQFERRETILFWKWRTSHLKIEKLFCK